MFEHKILGTDKPWLDMFYAPWCGHCTRFMPEYEDVAVMLRGQVSVGKVNCEKYGGMCNRAAVRGYPTLRYYRGRSGAGDDVQLYTSHDIKEREEKIKPVVDENKRPTEEGDDHANENSDDDSDPVFDDDGFENFYDDEEVLNYHDEL